MKTKSHGENHRKSMSVTERLFWREAFVGLINGWARVGVPPEIRDAADFADAAVEEYRQRVIWKRSNG